MARFKVEINRAELAKLIKSLEKYENPFSRNDSHDIARSVIDEMKDLISKGISPVRSRGGGSSRFPGYAATRAKAAVKELKKVAEQSGSDRAKKLIQSETRKIKQRKYPYSVMPRYPGKQVRPVNLWLSGDFLKALSFRLLPGKGANIQIGYYDKLSKDKERGHRDGHNKQAKRPTIPVPSQGERFAKRIELVIQQRLAEAIKKLIRK